MGWPEVVIKWPKITKLRLENGAATVGFAGQIPARLAAVGRKILRPASFGGGSPRGPCVYSNSHRWCLIWSDSHGAQVATRPKWCSRFGEFSLRVFGAQVLFCG